MGSIAQLVERLVCTEEVGSSNLPESKKRKIGAGQAAEATGSNPVRSKKRKAPVSGKHTTPGLLLRNGIISRKASVTEPDAGDTVRSTAGRSSPPVRGQHIAPYWIISQYLNFRYLQTAYILIMYGQDNKNKGIRKVYREIAKSETRSRISGIEVAKKVKRPQSYISRVESGEYRLDILEVKKFAKIYKKSVEYFIK